MRRRATSGVSWAKRSERTRATRCIRWTSEVYFELPENLASGDSVDSAHHRLLGPLVEKVPADDAEADRTVLPEVVAHADRKSTRLNSSHLGISYAVFCWKKKIIEAHNIVAAGQG